MRIVAYFINWNDSFYIPFFYRHYSKFCEKIVMYDQHSSDDSREIAKLLGIEVREFGNNRLNDQVYLDVKNHCWKECRGKGIDYVIVADADEFIVLPERLDNPFPRVIGYNMISEELPKNDVFEIKTGDESESYSKRALFNPDYVIEINYVHGCHKCNPTFKHGNTTDSWIGDSRAASLFHYRMIGGVDLLIERHATYRKRMSDFNNKHKMGFHYHHSDDAKRNEWNHLKEKAKELW